MQRLTTKMFMLLCMTLFVLGLVPVQADGTSIDVAQKNDVGIVPPKGIVKHKDIEDVGEIVGVWIKSDGDIVVMGKNPEGLPSEVKVMGYDCVTRDGKSRQFKPTAKNEWIVDLDGLKIDNVKDGSGVSKDNMMKCFFSKGKTIEGLDSSSLVKSRDLGELENNKKYFINFSLQEPNPYQNGWLESFHNIKFNVKRTTIGQPLPGSLGLMACGSALLWMFSRYRRD